MASSKWPEDSPKFIRYFLSCNCFTVYTNPTSLPKFSSNIDMRRHFGSKKVKEPPFLISEGIIHFQFAFLSGTLEIKETASRMLHFVT